MRANRNKGIAFGIAAQVGDSLKIELRALPFNSAPQKTLSTFRFFSNLMLVVYHGLYTKILMFVVIDFLTREIIAVIQYYNSREEDRYFVSEICRKKEMRQFLLHL